MKSIRNIMALFFLATSLPAPASAEERPILAVFDMEDRGAGLSQETLNNLTDYLAAMLTEGGYQIIPRNQIRERLKQQQTESYKECFDQSCQIELGKELAAQKSLSTKVLKIGKKCRVTGDLYDLKRAASEKAATAGSGCSEDDLLAAAAEVAAKLTGKKVEKEPPPEEPLAAPELVESDAMRLKRKKAEERRLTLERFRAGRFDKGGPGPPPPVLPKPKPRPPPARPPVKVRRKLIDYTWNISFKFGVLMPALAEDEGIKVDGAAIDTDAGIFIDSQIDLRLGPSLSFGAYLYFAHSSGTQRDGNEGDFDFLSLGGRIKYVMIASDHFAFRPYFGMGWGTFLAGAKYIGSKSSQEVSLEGASGLNAGLAIEAVYYLTDSLGLIIDFGLVAQGSGTKEQDGSDYDVTFNPLLYLLFGFEFGG